MIITVVTLMYHTTNFSFSSPVFTIRNFPCSYIVQVLLRVLDETADVSLKQFLLPPKASEDSSDTPLTSQALVQLERDAEQSSRSRGSNVLTDEQRLLRRLMRNYDSNTRPVFNASHAVVVRLGITLNQIFDLASHFVTS